MQNDRHEPIVFIEKIIPSEIEKILYCFQYKIYNVSTRLNLFGYFTILNMLRPLIILYYPLVHK